MGKFADKYLELEPWGLGEMGFHPDRSRVSESLFSLANEVLGVRGTFEEGYGGDTLRGHYVSGVYEVQKTQGSYKGVSDRVCFMVNNLDWSLLRLRVNGEYLDLFRSRFRDFHRHLDFRTGLLQRSLVWQCSAGPEIKVRFSRFLAMDAPEQVYQQVELESLRGSCTVEISAGIDAGTTHEMYKTRYWKPLTRHEIPHGAGILAESTGVGHHVYASFVLQGLPESRYLAEGEAVWRIGSVDLEPGKPIRVEKNGRISLLKSPQDGAPSIPSGGTRNDHLDFAAALQANRRYWDKVWASADITIEGDPENQQGIRFSIFQLEQTYRGVLEGANIGAKGLSGEAYNGNAFWDTEVYCLPYYLYRNPDAARSLLDFRYQTLDQARARAVDLDCTGACFPVATIDGTESCTLWQHASLQFQPTSGVCYAIRHYLEARQDEAWFEARGAELIFESARFLASRCQWSERKGAWGYYAVMGPDEFQMMVNHNAYTNFMGARSLGWAAAKARALAEHRPEVWTALASRIGIRMDEVERWESISQNMYLPYDGATGLYEQHEGFFDLPHVDIRAIPAEEFPLYHHWSYDRIYRNDMIKQPDVLMFMLLYPHEFSREVKRVNYEYYEPRCIHESSLSPSVHSILAMELGRTDEAMEFFRFATRIDLDNYNRNTREGLHLTAIAAAWMNIVYGFGGFRPGAEVPILKPRLPDGWKSCTFSLRLGDALVKVHVRPDGAELDLLEGNPVTLEVYGIRRVVDGELSCPLPEGVLV